MKKQSNSLFTEIRHEQLYNLTSIVKETLAIGFNQSKSKLFTTANLWNIQRHGKKNTQRRFSA